MDEERGKVVVRTIRATPENAAEMQRLVKSWPELHGLVKHLQAEGLFPGLRGLQITLTGSREHVARGLGAAMVENAPEGVLEASDEN